MADSDSFLDDLEEFELDLNLDDLSPNKRICVRYKRQDIKAVVKTRSLFFSRLFRVQLLDISSKGAAVHCKKPLKPKTRLDFFLFFKDGRRFTISATVAYSQLEPPRYGLKFDRYQSELGEHLLNSQTDLHYG